MKEFFRSIKYSFVLAISISFGILYGGDVDADPSIQANTPAYSWIYILIFDLLGWDYTDDTVLTSLGSNDGTMMNMSVPDPIRRNVFSPGGASVYPNGNIEVINLFSATDPVNATGFVARIDLSTGDLLDPASGASLQEAGSDISITNHLEICVLTGSTC